MNYKAQYNQVFGLTESASKAEVKRAYRKLAMKYHPDRNDDPKAHKLFLDLTEAYQIIIDDKPRPSETIVSPKRTDKTNEERIKEAQERLRKQTERNKINQEIFIQKLTSGLKFKVFKILAIVSTFLAVILIVEKILPSRLQESRVISYSKIYNGLVHDEIRLFKTENEQSFFLEDPNPNRLFDNPEIVVESSIWMRNPIRVWSRGIYSYKSYGVDFSIINLFPIVPLLLLIPIYTWKFAKRKYGFIVLLNFSVYAISIFVIYILISENRWLHLLTFGFV